MAVLKCKMCGGDLNLIADASTAECEFCGSVQTIPKVDNEKKLTLFARANRLRIACEFDKAAGVYESIVADFPEEAESYWGLVLCKYGIEYVDDPASGKKIPTCHRSSYDSVMDDANLELAMDYADAAARKVYREEAKQLEQIRKGILEVSSNEKPYDVFICYKETDENGDRTLDSVLAQDLYSALTDKGYRVFFSRITLQSKLGEAYEPYIFAALNSAKVMLAIGADPEYYNAVWVKNEWSRYLKICAADKSRHLIPCYKDLDAYDLPKEFRPLQGVDLGKMGAVQDILFNMEKYIPLQKKTAAVIQEKVVVGGTGSNNKIASLLDRGNMALEDGDWAKADSFFEDVLNNDSKNAQAYIGKTLAQERCRTMDALVRKRKDVYQNVRSEMLYAKENTAHINSIVDQYNLPGYVDTNTIRNLYKFDLSYSSEVSGRQKQYHEEEIWWQNHKQLSRAEKFAIGAVAEYLQREKNHLFTQLAERVKKALEADARATSKLEVAYDAHIAEADKRAEEMHNDALTRRENDYRNWLAQAKRETKPETLNKLAAKFAELGDYKDSKNLAEHCRKRAADEQDRIDTAALRNAAERAKRNKKIAMIVTPIICMTVVFALILNFVIIPNNRYNKALSLIEEGKHREAIAFLEKIDGYKDSADLLPECYYIDATAHLDANQTAEAAIAFGKAGAYKDAKGQSLLLWGEIAKRDTIEAGGSHTVGLKADGTVVAAGWNDDGQCNVSGWKDIVAVSAGSWYTVCLKTDGTVVAVGSNSHGQCDVSDWKDIIAISTGMHHTVGLKADGTVIATGMSDDGQCNVSDWEDIIAISAGNFHTVGLKADGTVVTTKYNGRFNVGQFKVSDWEDIIAVSAGSYHTVGLKADGTVVAVGDNDDSQCDVSDWKDIVAISAHSFHTVGLKADGTLVATEYTGVFNDGQCNVDGWSDIVAISTGTSHTVGLMADGTVVAVGKNYNRQCEVSDWTDIKVPESINAQQEEQLAGEEARLAKEYAAAVALAENGEKGKAAIAFAKMGTYKDAKERSLQLWSEIAQRDTFSAGVIHTIAIKNNGTVVATGDNEKKQCNTSDWTDIVSVAAGGWHTLGLKSDGTVIACGNNKDGQSNVSDLTDIVSIAGGGWHSVGLKSDGTVVAVGLTDDDRCEVSDWNSIVEVAAGDWHTVGLKSDGTVVATGSNKYGQCDVSEWTDIAAIITGAYHTVGLKTDGTVVATKYIGDEQYYYGQCDVSSWTDIVAITAGSYYTVGLKADGTVVAVGRNSYGQCDVSGLRDIVAISAGGYHAVGLKANGTVVAVGSNSYGQCDVSGWTGIKLPG